MNLAALFFGSFLVALSGALAPGPLLAITVERSVKRGFRAGPLLMTGHALLEAAVVILIIHGLSGFLLRPGVDRTLSLSGGVLLVIMGAMMLRGREKIEAEPGASPARGPDILYGALGSAANPYWSIWWVSVGMAYMALALPRGFAGVAVFFTGHIAADFAWYSAVSYSVSKGRKKISGKLYRNASFACGVFLICFGCWFFARGAGGFPGVPG